MLFLVSGASGMGKSTVRELVAPRLGEAFEPVELRDLAPTDAVSVRWRQETAELAAARASVLRAAGRHLLLSGDPVAPAELIAAPSSTLVGGVAVCVLDATPEAQTLRLRERGDDPDLFDAQRGFAQWMREHAEDPLTRLGVVSRDSAPDARWHRVARLVDQNRWRVDVVDTTHRSSEQVADAVAEWVATTLVDRSVVMYPDDA